MNTSKKWFAIGSVMLLTIGGITMLNLNGENSSVLQRTKAKQLAYLKEHEQEIIAWMKSKYPKVESVQFDWDTLEVGPVSNGIITTHYNLSVKGTFNNIPETVIYIDFRLDKLDSIPSMNRITMNQPPSIKKGGGLYNYE